MLLLRRLNNPTATLYGFDANNTGHAILLTLASPAADSANKVCHMPQNACGAQQSEMGAAQPSPVCLLCYAAWCCP